MIKFFIKGFFTFIGMAVFAYVFFFVELGERTLFQHVKRIAATEEAQDLGDDIGAASDRLRAHLEERIREELAEDGELSEGLRERVREELGVDGADALGREIGADLDESLRETLREQLGAEIEHAGELDPAAAEEELRRQVETRVRRVEAD